MVAALESKLWKPLQVGAVRVSHRIALAPLTRFRNDDNHDPTDMMVQYYGERASVPGTLIVTEATGSSASAEGAANLPGIHSETQKRGWAKIYNAIHERGSFVFQQLWHQGRTADPKYLAAHGGYRLVSSSAKKLSDRDETAPTPEALTETEILGIVDDFRRAARNVIDAGGDGIELHGAHGYLFDQFLRDSINDRTDRWGGSDENRARFLLAVVEAVCAEIGADRVGLRLSPFATFQDAYSSDTWSQTGYVLDQLRARGFRLAYLSLVEPRGDPNYHVAPDKTVGRFTGGEKSLQYFLRRWDNYSPVVVAGAYSLENAAPAVDGEYAEWDVIVAFGRSFISNPDLVFRVKNGIPFSPYNRDTFYTSKTSEGYIDYTFSEEALKAGFGPHRIKAKA